MDIVTNLIQLANRVPTQIEHLTTEEATKNALIMPFLSALGYNVFDPTEIRPEFTTDVGVKKGEKVDYAVMKEGKPIILIECKKIGTELKIEHSSQLYRYFSVAESRLAFLTNGIKYQFYTDIDSPNKMDNKPFFEFDLLSLDDSVFEQLKKFEKQHFNLENILSNASELKYTKEVIKCLKEEFINPSEEFIKYFAGKVHAGKMTSAIKLKFQPIITSALKQFIKDTVNDRIKMALEKNNSSDDAILQANEPELEDKANTKEIITTQEELDAYNIIRAIGSQIVDVERIAIRDTLSYCGILLDDNNRKPICRLRFNKTSKFLLLLDNDKNEEKIPIEKATDIYKFSDKITESIKNMI